MYVEIPQLFFFLFFVHDAENSTREYEFSSF